MNKQDLINDIVASIADLDKSIQDRIKITLTVKLQNLDVVESIQLPSTEVKDNDYIYQRFTMDMLAKGLKPSSIKGYMHYVKTFIEWTGLNYLEITGQNITDYLAVIQYKKKPNGELYSKGNATNACKAIFVFFKWAYKRRHIQEDITRDVDRVKDSVKHKCRISPEDIEKCREACNTIRERALLELMLSTGMRVAELRDLKIEDLNFKARTVDIHGTKTANAERVGTLSYGAVHALQAYIDGRTSGYVFTSDRFKEKEKLTTGSINAIAKAIGARAGCKLVTTVHVYRKTFATEMYHKCHDVKLVSTLLGHSTSAVTEKYYLVDDFADVTARALMVS